MKNKKWLGALLLSATMLLSGCGEAEMTTIENEALVSMQQESANAPSAAIEEPVPYRMDDYTNFDFPYVLDFVSDAVINKEYDDYGYCAIANGTHSKTIHYTKAIYNDYNSAIVGCGLAKEPAKTGYVYNNADYGVETKIVDMGGDAEAVSQTLADTDNTLCPQCFHKEDSVAKFQQYLADMCLADVKYITTEAVYSDIDGVVIEMSDYTKFQDGINEIWSDPKYIQPWDFMPHIFTTFGYAKAPYQDGTSMIHAVKSVANLEQFAILACDKDLFVIDYRDQSLPHGSIYQYTHESVNFNKKYNELYRLQGNGGEDLTLCPTCFDSEKDIETLLNHTEWIGLEEFNCKVQDNDGYYKYYSMGE